VASAHADLLDVVVPGDGLHGVEGGAGGAARHLVPALLEGDGDPHGRGV
jgi:hypothetical protein